MPKNKKGQFYLSNEAIKKLKEKMEDGVVLVYNVLKIPKHPLELQETYNARYLYQQDNENSIPLRESIFNIKKEVLTDQVDGCNLCEEYTSLSIEILSSRTASRLSITRFE